jgi:diacylglycerol kinase family enzyme
MPENPPPPNNPEPSPDETQGAPPSKLALFISLAFGIIGLALLIWLSTFPGELTSQQETLSDTADWLMKGGGGSAIGSYATNRASQ